MAGLGRTLRDLTARVTGLVPAGQVPPAPVPAGQVPPAQVPPAQVPPAQVPPAQVPREQVAVEVRGTGGDGSGTSGAGTRDTGSAPASGEPAAEETAMPLTSVQDPPDVDPALAAAVDLARAVAVEAGGVHVGEHLGVQAEGPADQLVALHAFACTDPAYVGWRWAVTLARAEGSGSVTVDEVVLLPGSGALVAPAWVPWAERVQPDDLSPGDLLPPPADDPRLVPAYAEPEAVLAAELFWELGLGRPRVLSAEGRLDAADRWYAGSSGPDSPMARQAPGRCGGCGFLVPLGGALGAAFGACANRQAPDDGRVVSLDHGCGAHSETPADPPPAPAAGMVVEDDAFELVPVAVPDEPAEPDDETPDGHAS